MIVCFRFLLLLLVVLLSARSADAAPDPDALVNKVEGIINVVEVVSQEAGKNTPETADPNSPEARREAMMRAQQIGQAQQLLAQLKKLKVAILLGKYSEAESTLSQLEALTYSIVQSENVIEDFVEIKKDLEQLQIQAVETWYSRVEMIVEKTRSVCLSAKEPVDLDALLIEVAAFEMNRNQRSNNPLIVRGNLKLSGVTSTLQNFAKYLDYKNAGNPEAANNIVKSIAGDKTGYPVLSKEEVEGMWLPVEPEENAVQYLIRILDAIESAEDIDWAIEEISEAQGNPKWSQDRGFDKSVLPKLESAKSGYAALKSGDMDRALEISKGLERYSGNTSYKPYFDSIQYHLTKDLVAAQLSDITGLKIEDIDSPFNLLHKELKKLYENGNYQQVVEILELKSTLEPNTQHNKLRESIEALNDFLAAQRFEEAGDFLAAYMKYKEVVQLPSDTWVPHEAAVASLKRLREDNPEMIKSFDESAIVMELEALRRSIQSMSRMNRMRPY